LNGTVTPEMLADRQNNAADFAGWMATQSGHCQTVPEVQQGSPANLPVWISVCVAYSLLGDMLCLKHEISDRPNQGNTPCIQFTKIR